MSDIKNLAKALLQAQREMGNAVKDSANPFFKSSYADLNAIREIAIPSLNKHGVTVLQPTVFYNDRSFVRTTLLHETGEVMVADTEIKNTKGDAQGEGSGISYARRYGLQSFLCIGAVDDDGEASVGRVNTNTKTGMANKAAPSVVQTATTVQPTKTVGVPTSATTDKSTAPKSNGIDGGNVDTQTAGKKPTKEIIEKAFKILEAQKKTTKEDFKRDCLGGKGLTSLSEAEAVQALVTIKTEYPELKLF